MPGAGKSTIGVILAKLTMRSFVDTDIVIQQTTGESLQTTVNTRGYEVLRQIEEDCLVNLDVQNHVISTGGSAVYSAAGMAELKRNGNVIFLDVDLATLEARIDNYTTRGLAKPADQSFDEMFAERNRLYRQYADITVPCINLTPEAVCQWIIETLG